MRRHVISTALILCITMLSAAAQGVQEISDEPMERTVSIAALQGPTGFGLARILDRGAVETDTITFDSQVLSAPPEAISRLASGELDAALLPVNLAAVIYNRGLGVTVPAVTGMGMIHLMSRDHTIRSWEDLPGASVSVPARGATPDYLTQHILKEYHLTELVELDYSVTSAPQLAQLLLAGKVQSAVLPEPFASLTDIQGGDEIQRALSFQDTWKDLHNTHDVYPMTLLIISTSLIEENPDYAKAVIQEVEGSIRWTLNNPAEAAQVIEKFGILSAPMAEPAIPNSGLTFISSKDSRKSIDEFLKVLHAFDPSSVGGTLPDESFYWWYR